MAGEWVDIMRQCTQSGAMECLLVSVAKFADKNPWLVAFVLTVGMLVKYRPEWIGEFAKWLLRVVKRFGRFLASAYYSLLRWVLR